MLASEFLQEALNDPRYADGFEKEYSEFQAYQKLAMDTLKEFHRVCEKNDIPYQLAYGSLLGAIRDGGQIPWDYDVDVFVPYQKKDALIRALSADLSDEFYFYCPEVDGRCRHYMMRLAPKGIRTEGIHVDVFYVAGAPKNPEERQSFAEEIYYLFNARYAKKVKIWETARGRMKTVAKLLLRRLQVFGKSTKRMNSRLEELCNKYPVEEAEICIPVNSLCKKNAFPTAMLRDTMLYETGEGTFRITKNYEQLLQLLYGDYKKIFPLDSRIAEVRSHLVALRFYNKLR